MNKLQYKTDAHKDWMEQQAENHEYVMEKSRAIEVLQFLEGKTAALDFETTGFSPYSNDVRLSCIYHEELGAVLIDHFFAGSFQQLVPLMLKVTWVVYYSKFEISWFDKVAYGKVELMDVDFLRKVKEGGMASSLKRLAKIDLGYDLDKAEQVSDWRKPSLSRSQLVYGALDAVVTHELFQKYIKKLDERQIEAAWMLQDAVRPTLECEDTGMSLDVDAHMRNIRTWERKQRIALSRLRRITPESMLKNPNSDVQLSNFLKTQLGKATLDAWPKTELTEQLSTNKKVLGPIAAKSPYPFSRWLNAVILYRYYMKYLSTYGLTLINKFYMDDKVTYRLNIAQAATCRYSSSSINIQNIPRNPTIRAAFLPPPPFTHFAVADYSGIEVRVLAELSQDAQLLRDAIYGDVHAGSASAINKIAEEVFLEIYGDATHPLNSRYKELRSRAKGFTFQNIYGAMATALSIVLNCSIAEAEEALVAWANRYPKAYNYRHVIHSKMSIDGYIPVCDGRTIFVNKKDRSLPVAANYGIQGAAASVMYRAMYRVHSLIRERNLHNVMRMCATVHDELILACTEEYQEEAKSALTEGMLLGWLDVFPDTDTHRLVEAKSGRTWGSAK